MSVQREEPSISVVSPEGASSGLISGALANINSEAALMNLHLLAEKSHFPAFKAAAAAHLDQIARARGLTREALVDRLAPRLTLDDGGATLDFGARRFTLSFNESLVPVIRDERGEVLKSLPRPRKDDDVAKEATARYRSLKRAAKAAAVLQVTRLERALVTQRAIPVSVFREHFAEHPWMTHLAQRLVWTVAGTGQTFKVEEDGGLMSADYELIQPFPQLARRTFGAAALAAVPGNEVTSRVLLGLERRGWQRIRDDMVIDGIRRPCGPGVALLSFEPGWYPSLEDDEIDPQRLTTLTLHARDGKVLEMSEEVDAVTLSELLYDVHDLFTEGA